MVSTIESSFWLGTFREDTDSENSALVITLIDENEKPCESSSTTWFKHQLISVTRLYPVLLVVDAKALTATKCSMGSIRMRYYFYSFSTLIASLCFVF